MAKEIKKHILSVYDENGNKIPIPAIGSKDYKLPAASENKLGGIKAPAKTPDQTVPVGVGEDNKLYVAPGGGEQVQSDWAENDPNNLAFVKNRPGGYTGKTIGESLFEEQTIQFYPRGTAIDGSDCGESTNVKLNKEYKIGDIAVIFNGIKYLTKARFIEQYYPGSNKWRVVIGNISKFPNNSGFAGEDTGEPFGLFRFAQLAEVESKTLNPVYPFKMYAQFINPPVKHLVKISAVVNGVVKFDESVLPDLKLPYLINKDITSWQSLEWKEAANAYSERRPVWNKEGDEYNNVFGIRVLSDNSYCGSRIENGIVEQYLCDASSGETKRWFLDQVIMSTPTHDKAFRITVDDSGKINTEEIVL